MPNLPARSPRVPLAAPAASPVSLRAPLMSSRLSTLSSRVSANPLRPDCVSSSCRSRFLSSALASFTASCHFSVFMSFSPYRSADFSSIPFSASTRFFCTSICLFNTSAVLCAFSSASVFSSKLAVTSFISLPRVFACCMIWLMLSRYSFSPSMPSLGPMLTAILFTPDSLFRRRSGAAHNPRRCI